MATICATGRLGRDAELRTTQGGTKVLSFSIADEVGWGADKKTQWFQCSLFGKRAEALAQYLVKGSLVELSGTPELQTWEKAGKTNAAIKIAVSEVRLHGGGAKSDGRVAAEHPRRIVPEDDDTSIPF